MSIIYDALKKVQNNTDNTKPTEKPAAIKPVGKKINPLLIYILVICAGLFLGNYAYKYFIPGTRHLITAKKENQVIKYRVPGITTPVKQIPPPAAITAEVPANTIPNAEPAFVLNGVFFEQGEGYALINNKIVRIGDEIEHAKVKEIRITGVELEFEGKTVKLLSPS